MKNTVTVTLTTTIAGQQVAFGQTLYVVDWTNTKNYPSGTREYARTAKFVNQEDAAKAAEFLTARGYSHVRQEMSKFRSFDYVFVNLGSFTKAFN